MNRIAPAVVFGLIVVGLAAWHFAVGTSDRNERGPAFMGVADDPVPDQTGPTTPPHMLAAPSVSGSDPSSTSSGADRLAGLAGDPEADPATGAAATVLPVPADQPAVSTPVGALPANSELDRATGVVLLRERADTAAAEPTTEPLPSGIEVDEATGAPVGR